MWRIVRIIAIIGMLCFGTAGARAADEETPAPTVQSCYAAASQPAWTGICIRQEHFFADTCGAIQRLALTNGLPAGFFARLIWQESRFDPGALSVAGAQGIAQFMPSTARLRGLTNSFDPAEALSKSAAYLSFLQGRFGNLGLAAAAYNGGENRVSRYTGAGGYLPSETRYYVEIVTGMSVEGWLASPLPEVDFALDAKAGFREACIKMAETESVPRLDRPPGEWHPWGVLLAENFSQAVAVARFERVQAAYGKAIGGEKLMLLMARNPNFGPRLRHFAMIGRDNRKDADALCASLQKAGGACVVRKN